MNFEIIIKQLQTRLTASENSRGDIFHENAVLQAKVKRFETENLELKTRIAEFEDDVDEL